MYSIFVVLPAERYQMLTVHHSVSCPFGRVGKLLAVAEDGPITSKRLLLPLLYVCVVYRHDTPLTRRL
jgi:hypothetical protein